MLTSNINSIIGTFIILGSLIVLACEGNFWLFVATIFLVIYIYLFWEDTLMLLNKKYYRQKILPLINRTDLNRKETNKLLAAMAFDVLTKEEIETAMASIASSRAATEPPPPINFGLGNINCKYNARSPHIRCAVNPNGPCEWCKDYSIDSSSNFSL